MRVEGDTLRATRGSWEAVPETKMSRTIWPPASVWFYRFSGPI